MATLSGRPFLEEFMNQIFPVVFFVGLQTAAVRMPTRLGTMRELTVLINNFLLKYDNCSWSLSTVFPKSTQSSLRWDRSFDWSWRSSQPASRFMSDWIFGTQALSRSCVYVPSTLNLHDPRRRSVVFKLRRCG